MITITFNNPEEKKLLQQVRASANRLLASTLDERGKKGMLKFWTLQAFETYLLHSKDMNADAKDELRKEFDRFCAEKNHRKEEEEEDGDPGNGDNKAGQ